MVHRRKSSFDPSIWYRPLESMSTIYFQLRSWLKSYLSGMKESGSGNRVGSRQIVHAARLTLVYLSAEVKNVGFTPPGME